MKSSEPLKFRNQSEYYLNLVLYICQKIFNLSHESVPLIHRILDWWTVPPWTRSPETDVNGGDHRAGSRQSHTNHPTRTGIYMYAQQYVNVNYNHSHVY